MLNLPFQHLFYKTQEWVYKKYSLLHHIIHLEGPNVWVLSPHPDDDVFGCGGTILQHIAQGHCVNIIYLCSGDKGIKGESAQSTIKIRQSEAQDAANILGIPNENLHFLGYPDENLSAHIHEASGKIQDLFMQKPPNIIYLPSFLDAHNDHRATNEILKVCDISNVFIAAYEVWTPLIPNRIVDISTSIQQKKAAMQAHKTQLQALDYATAITGLNQYRANLYTKKKMAYAEAFLCEPHSVYISLW